MQNSIIVTGAAGFIGSNFVIEWAREECDSVIAFDLLSYAGNLRNLSEVLHSSKHSFVRGDINDREKLQKLFAARQPRAVIHFAAESHVDRSILGPDEFIRTNINGTFHLLSAAREYWNSLSSVDKDSFRFLHVSTDEVYGSLSLDDPPFSETTAYAPNSPYSASKAASDHLVRAFHHTYGLPVLTTNCSNNYGPYQFPEKLIPLIISHALKEKPLPIYGDGLNIRDWLYVGDHCRAIRMVLRDGKPGETYNIGGKNEIANINVVRTICAVLDELRPKGSGSYSELITYVKDRPGHDRRYAIDATKLEREIGWKPEETFATGIRKTVQWYLDHQQWVAEVESGAYRDWIEANYAEREKTCGV